MPTTPHITIKNVQSGEAPTTDAKYVFIGAGGDALKLLQKPVLRKRRLAASGRPSFLMTENPAVAAGACEVSWPGFVGTPPMSVPRLDARCLDGKRVVLSAVSLLDQVPEKWFSSSICSALPPPITCADDPRRLDNSNLVEIHVPVMLSDDDRFAALKSTTRTRVKKLETDRAGQRVRIIRDAGGQRAGARYRSGGRIGRKPFPRCLALRRGFRRRANRPERARPMSRSSLTRRSGRAAFTLCAELRPEAER